MSQFKVTSASFATRGPRAALAPLAAGVLLALAASAHASQPSVPAPASTAYGAPQSLVVDAQPAPAAAPASGPAQPAATPVTASTPAVPSSGQASLNPTPPVAVAPAPSADLYAGKLSGPDVPWSLTSDQHPWPLRYRALPPVMSLYLDLPSPADTKLELPGIAADQAERARVAVNQYFSNLLGSDNRTRGGQLDALSTWLDRMGQQEMSLDATDVWAHYEFSHEALAQITQFRDGVAAQTEPQSRQVLAEVRNAIARITPLVQLMPTYETRLAWYNVLVQLKDGLAEYQSQASDTDQKLLTAIDTYLATHPAVSQPAGDIPPRPQGFARARVSAPATASQAQVPSAVSTLQDTHAPAAMPPEKKQSSSIVGSLLVALFAVLTLGWVAMKIRGRNKGGLKLPARSTKKTP